MNFQAGLADEGADSVLVYLAIDISVSERESALTLKFETDTCGC